MSENRDKKEKKLVQARLPFLVARTPAKDPDIEVIEADTPADNLNENGKKKRSDSFEDEQSAKKPKLSEDIDLTLENEEPMDEDAESEPDEKEKMKPTTPTSVKMAKKTTPKQMEKQIEAAKRREEKERLRQEKCLKKEEERREKLKVREEKRKELELRELEKKKAKEEKERRKQQEIEAKNEEKLRKEAEKKKKEEEDLANKKKFAKEAAVFTNFFTKVDADRLMTNSTEIKNGFKPFAVKNRMRLAPIFRNPLDETRRTVFDEEFRTQQRSQLYLAQLKNGTIRPKNGTNTWPLEELYQEDDAEVEVITEETETKKVAKRERKYQAKLLQFCENRRPPYWGTWRKRGAAVGPRRPFGRFKDFDYDVDSDDEWEEEEPGESLHGSDDEKEKEDVDGEDDYEVDNEVFVPHGYLSEDEEQPDEAWDVEQQKEKLKLLGEQFDNERNEKTRKLRPIVVGCVWVNGSKFTTGNEKLDALFERCLPYANDCEFPLVFERNDAADVCSTDGAEIVSPGSTVRRGGVPEDAVPLLLSKVHGVSIRHRTIARQFVTDWINEGKSQHLLSVASVSRKIRELAQWQQANGKFCWVVLPEFREKYGLCDLEVSSSDDLPATLSPAAVKITKFTKVLTEEERRNSLKPRTTTTEEPTDNRENPVMVDKTIQKLDQFRMKTEPKKRVAILCSAPLGVAITKTSSSPK